MLQNNANETWLKQVNLLMNMWKMCLSAPLTCAPETEPPGFLEHLIVPGSPIPAEVGSGRMNPTAKVMASVTPPRPILRGPPGTVFGYRTTPLHSRLA